MKSVRLGNTDVQVSVLCLGAMYFGSSIDVSTSYQLLDQYLEAGVDSGETCHPFWLKVYH